MWVRAVSGAAGSACGRRGHCASALAGGPRALTRSWAWRAGVLGRAREQARAAWARAGGGERELGLARVVCWASLSWVWILGSFPFPFLFPFLSTQNYLNSNEFEFKLLYKQTKQNHAPA